VQCQKIPVPTPRKLIGNSMGWGVGVKNQNFKVGNLTAISGVERDLLE